MTADDATATCTDVTAQCDPDGSTTWYWTLGAYCDWTISVTWGDGVQSLYDYYNDTASTIYPSDSHTYAEPGIYMTSNTITGTPYVSGYTCNPSSNSFTVDYPGLLTVTASGSQTYGSSSHNFTYSDNAPGGVIVTGTLTCTTVDGGTPINASLAPGSYTIDGSSCSGLESSNSAYTFDYVGATNGFVVSSSTITVTASGSQAYGSSSHNFTYSDNAPGGVIVTGTLTCTTVDGGTPINASLAPGSYTIDGSSCTGLSATDYTIDYVGATNGFVVSLPTITVTASGSQTFGSSSPNFTYTDNAPGGVSVTGTLVCTKVLGGRGGTPINASLALGSYTIDESSCTGLSATDYTIDYVGAPNGFAVSSLSTTLGLSVSPSTGSVGTSVGGSTIAASLAGGTTPTGTITFYVSGPSPSAPTTCPGTMNVIGAATVSGNGTYTSSGGFTPSSPGDYWFYAVYGGDTNNAGSASPCAPGTAQELTVSSLSTTLGLSVSPSTGSVGTSVGGSTIAASLAGGTTPTGTITFYVSGPSPSAPTTCPGTMNVIGAATVSGNGTYTSSGGFTPSSPGDYWFYAVYGGDTNNAGSASPCAPGTAQELTVSSLSTTLGLSVSPSTGSVGTSVGGSTIAASLAGGTTPTGTITFYVSGPSPSAPTTCPGTMNVIGAATVSGNGTYTSSGGFTPSSPGDYWFYAVYGGDTNNAGSASPCAPGTAQELTVSSLSTTLGLSVSPSTGSVGTSVGGSTIAASLAGGTTPTGTITFYVSGPSPSAPTTCPGTMNVIGAATVSGNGTYTSSGGFTPSSPGDYWFYAVYGGDTNNAGSASPCAPGTAQELTVSSLSTTLGLSVSPSTGSVGTSVGGSTIAASLAGGTTPTGTITFYVSGPSPSAPTTCPGTMNVIGAATVSGNGTYTSSGGFTPSSPGDYWFYAVYGGDTNNAGSASPCAPGTAQELTVSSLSTTLGLSVSPSTGSVGTSVGGSTIAASLAGGTTPTGTITFYVSGPSPSAPTTCPGTMNVIGAATVSGNGTYTSSGGFTPSSPGDYWFYAVYGGDTNNAGSASPCAPGTAQELTVSSLSTTLGLSVSPSTGSVGTSVGGSTIAASLAGGTTPTGTITFYVSGPSPSAPTTCPGTMNVIGAATVSGNGTYTSSGGFTPSSPGDYWFYAVYGGDTNNAGSASPCAPGTAQELTVSSLSTTLGLSVSPSTGSVGTSVGGSTIAASLAGGTTPTGTITFYVSGPSPSAPTTCPGTMNVIGAATVSGNGTYTSSGGFTPSSPGDYWFYAVYGGDTNNAGSASPCAPGTAQELTVSSLSTTLGLSVSPSTGSVGTSVGGSTIAASLAGGTTPTGTITFYVSGPSPSAPTTCPGTMNVIGAATVSGNGTYTSSGGFTPSSPGDYWFYAVYGGDTNNAGSASPCAPGTAQELTVAKAAPTISTTPTVTHVNLGSVTPPLLSDTATLSGGHSPTGIITFTLVDTSTNTTVDTEIVSVSGDGAFSTPKGYTLPATGTVTGTYQWNATYSGDDNNAGFSENGNVGEQVSVAIADPSLTSTPSITSVTLSGTPVALKDTVVIANSYHAQGSLIFTLVYNGITVDSQTVTANGNGSYSTPAGYTLPATGTVTGTYQWNVTYSGDGNNKATSETNNTNEQVVVKARPESTTTSMSVAKSDVTYGAEAGQSISGVVTGQRNDGAPEGTVNVTYGPSATPLCSATLVPGTGDTSTYKCALSSNTQLAPANYPTVRATFVPAAISSTSPNFAYTTSTSGACTGDSFVVEKDSTMTKISVSPTTVTAGTESSAIFSVSVTTGGGETVPSGETVSVKVGSASCTVTLSSGKGTCSITNSALVAGCYSVTASYLGDTYLLNSIGSGPQLTVKKK